MWFPSCPPVNHWRTAWINLESEAPVHIVSSITIAAFWLPPLSKTFQATAARCRSLSGSRKRCQRNGDPAPWKSRSGTDRRLSSPGMFLLQTICRIFAECCMCPGHSSPAVPMDLESFCSASLLLREKEVRSVMRLTVSLLLAGHTARPAWTSVNSLALIRNPQKPVLASPYFRTSS